MLYDSVKLKKPCNVCKKAKPIVDFHKCSSGRMGFCKDCRSIKRAHEKGHRLHPDNFVSSKRKRVNAIYMKKWGMKICAKCNVMKNHPSEFHTNQAYCAQCSNKMNAEYWAEINKSVTKIAYKKYGMCRPSKANQKGIRSRSEFLTQEEWNKTFDDHVAKHGLYCAVTKVAFDGSNPLLRPSPDQIIPKGGYTKDNIRWTTTQYNISRQDNTDEEMFEMAKAICRAKGCVIHESVEY